MSDTPRKKKVPAAAADTAALEARLEALRAEIDDIQAGLAATAGKEAGTAAAKAGEISEDVLKEARQALKKIHKQAASLEETLGVQTRDNPLQTLLIAFGAGFVASLLLRR
ncbi:MAG: hypothetical protein ACK4MQ_11000 [Hyphomonas sp.]